MTEAATDNDDLPRSIAWFVAAAAVTTTLLRFGFQRDLWLDEALSVHIASAPIGDLADALRQDGHPPLYYVMLGIWTDVLGTGTIAVRALSALTAALATWPIAQLGRRVDARRGAATAAAVWALSPFALRYGSEARMYALVVVLTAMLTLVGLRHLDGSPGVESRLGRFGGPLAVAILASALLWTHYWGLWFLGGAAVALLVDMWWSRRNGDDHRARAGIELAGALAVAGMTFIPWLGVLLYQAEHTGTPWADPLRPAEIVVAAFTDFFGGPYSEPQLAMFVGIVVLVIGALGTHVSNRGIMLRWRLAPEIRDVAVLLVSVLLVASAAGVATRSAFAARYAAIFYPLTLIVFTRGLCQLRGHTTRRLMAVIGTIVALGACWMSQSQQRTQAGEIAETLLADDAGRQALVVVCPDQLGPATSRALDRAGANADVVRYPDLESARRVNWVDYAERNGDAEPAEAAERIKNLAGDRPIALVMMDTYRTLEGQCGELLSLLATGRSARQLEEANVEDYFEPMNLFVVEAPR